VDCVAEFEPYRVKTMKKNLLKKRSPQPATVSEQHEDTEPAKAKAESTSLGPLATVSWSKGKVEGASAVLSRRPRLAVGPADDDSQPQISMRPKRFSRATSAKISKTPGNATCLSTLSAKRSRRTLPPHLAEQVP